MVKGIATMNMLCSVLMSVCNLFQVRQMCVRTLRYKVVIEGASTDVSSMGFNQPIPPEGTVWDYMFDFDEIK
jgi:hypothetical protein